MVDDAEVRTRGCCRCQMETGGDEEEEEEEEEEEDKED